eukprot:m.15064 g.15064  ORF g.15064 m.15064 type:complete len:59 (-) comp5272_c0_seq1:2989-3165(-)
MLFILVLVTHASFAEPLGLDACLDDGTDIQSKKQELEQVAKSITGEFVFLSLIASLLS